MDFTGVYHKASEQMCYPLNEDELIVNLKTGYDVKRVWKTCPLQQLRVYFTAQNLFTITGYKGMDPENGMALNSNEPWVTGVDVGNYPQPRTYMFGVNVKF